MNIVSLLIAIISNLKDIIWFVQKLSGKSSKDKETIRLLVEDAFNKLQKGDTSSVEKIVSDL